MASVRQAFFLVTRISSHDFPLASEETYIAPVNHPALMKTSDQPSFSSVNFSPFTSVEAFIIRYQQPYAKPEPTAKSSSWNSKENTEFPLQIYIEANQKEKIKQNTKSKPIGWYFKKDGREGFVGIQLRLTIRQIRTLT